MLVLIFALSFLIASFSGEVIAQERPINGNDMLVKCMKAEMHIDSKRLQNTGDLMDAAFCIGALDGMDAYNFVMEALEKDQMYCPPPGIGTNQRIRIVVKFLRDNPQKLHRDGYFLVLKAFNDAFPCS